jgi:hypothetical protein
MNRKSLLSAGEWPDTGLYICWKIPIKISADVIWGEKRKGEEKKGESVKEKGRRGKKKEERGKKKEERGNKKRKGEVKG